jgi:hypothetical protein
MKNLIVKAADPCPCKSGKTYLECCLDDRHKFVYMQDKNGKVVKVTTTPKQRIVNSQKQNKNEAKFLAGIVQSIELLSLTYDGDGEDSAGTHICGDLSKISRWGLEGISHNISMFQFRIISESIPRSEDENDEILDDWTFEGELPIISVGLDKHGHVLHMELFSGLDQMPYEDLEVIYAGLDNLKMAMIVELSKKYGEKDRDAPGMFKVSWKGFPK